MCWWLGVEWSLFCDIVLRGLSWLLYFTCARVLVCVSLFYYILVSIPHGASGWSEICDCGISWACSFLFVYRTSIIILLRNAIVISAI